MCTATLPPSAEWPSLAPHPGTITWRRAGDARVLIAAGYALLLQVSHPTVGAGVSEHSQFKRDPWGRLLRTLDYSCTMVYGGARAAGEMGRRIRRMHRQISGTGPDGLPYSALEPEAYAWVHATLAEGIVRAHERFGLPFSEAQCEQLWGEWRAVGRLLGVSAGILPAEWRGFREYVGEMVARRLEHTEAVDEVLAALARPAAPSLPALSGPVWAAARLPLGHFLRLTTTGLLAPALRVRFGLRWTPIDDFQMRLIGRTLRAATPLMPGWLRNTGPGYLRWRARASQPRTSRL